MTNVNMWTLSLVYAKQSCAEEATSYTRSTSLRTEIYPRQLIRLSTCQLLQESSPRIPWATLLCIQDRIRHDIITNNFVCLSATSSSVAFVRHWLNHMVSSLPQPANALRYQWGPAHWHSSMSKHLPIRPNAKPNHAWQRKTMWGRLGGNTKNIKSA
jgi:hypothetical protein